MQANVFVFGHHSICFQTVTDIQILTCISRGRFQSCPQVGLITIGYKADAIHGTNINAGIALDT